MEKTAVDLGLYNYVKNGFAEGKSKEEIMQSLQKGNWSEQDIEKALDAVTKKDEPRLPKPKPANKPSDILTLFIFLALIIAGILAFTTYRIQISSLSKSLTSSHTALINVAPLQTYTEPEIGVSMEIPSDWVTAKNEVPNSPTVTGFTASKNVDPFASAVVSVQVNQENTTMTLDQIVAAQRTTISEKTSANILKDADMTIGGQSGHVFEYTYVSDGEIYHEMDAYVFNSNSLYVYMTNGLDGNWNQIPAVEMLSSLTFTH